jgi:hypothetical protein
MTGRTIKSTFMFCIFSVGAFVACGQVVNKTVTEQKLPNQTSLQLDTTNTVIIAFSKKNTWLFDSTYTSATLSLDDLQMIDSILLVCVNNYNNSLDREHKMWSIDLRKNNYKKQLIAVSNKKGQKEVLVNCFCSTWNNNWRTAILVVHDGGNCYFNLKINLTTRKFYDLVVNGEA